MLTSSSSAQVPHDVITTQTLPSYADRPYQISWVPNSVLSSLDWVWTAVRSTCTNQKGFQGVWEGLGDQLEYLDCHIHKLFCGVSTGMKIRKCLHKSPKRNKPSRNFVRHTDSYREGWDLEDPSCHLPALAPACARPGGRGSIKGFVSFPTQGHPWLGLFFVIIKGRTWAVSANIHSPHNPQILHLQRPIEK